QDGRDASGRHHRVGDEGKIALVEHPPITAVDEEMDGRGPYLPLGEEQVQAFELARTIGHIELGAAPRAGRSAALVIDLDIGVEVRDVVAGTKEIHGSLQIVVATYFASRNSRMPWAPPSRPSPLCLT